MEKCRATCSVATTILKTYQHFQNAQCFTNVHQLGPRFSFVYIEKSSGMSRIVVVYRKGVPPYITNYLNNLVL